MQKGEGQDTGIDRYLDETPIIKNDAVLVPEGCHPVSASPRYESDGRIDPYVGVPQ